MPELPDNEMAHYALQYVAIDTKYWSEVKLVVIHHPQQYQQQGAEGAVGPDHQLLLLRES